MAEATTFSLPKTVQGNELKTGTVVYTGGLCYYIDSLVMEYKDDAQSWQFNGTLCINNKPRMELGNAVVEFSDGELSEEDPLLGQEDSEEMIREDMNVSATDYCVKHQIEPSEDGTDYIKTQRDDIAARYKKLYSA